MSSFSIPADFPLSDLPAQELTQICIGANEIGLNFYLIAPDPHQWKPGAAIQIEAGFELSKDGVVLCASGNEQLGCNAGRLTALLRHSVVAVAHLPDNELMLTFSDDFHLRLLTSPQGFESYRLQVGEQSIDVVQ